MALAGEPLDSRLELVVVDGGGKGTRVYLDRTHITLGRRDPEDEPTAGVITFPDPTVSRVHAVLEWDRKKNAYLLVHRSRTNATVLNGTQVTEPEHIKAGDRVKMGSLLVELRQADPSQRPPEVLISEPLESDLHLLVLSGEDRGQLHPLNYTRFVVGTSGPADGPTLRIDLPDASENELNLVWNEDGFFAKPGKGVAYLVDLLPGIARQRVPDADGLTRLSPGTALVMGTSVSLLVHTQEAGEMVQQVKAGTPCHAVQKGLDPTCARLWDGGEFHCLRLLSNPLKGTVLWLRPEKLDAPVSIDRQDSGREATLLLSDRQAPRVELEFTSKGRVLLRNADEELKLGQNWDEVTPGEEVYLVSGDRFRLGRTVFRYEDVRLQPRIERLALRCGDEVTPLARAVNTIGYTTTVDLRVDDRRLSPTHGQIEVRPDAVVYRHLHAGEPARVDDSEVEEGQEAVIEPGSHILLIPEVEVELVRREEQESLTEPVLIGPTQEQIEAARSSDG